MPPQYCEQTTLTPGKCLASLTSQTVDSVEEESRICTLSKLSNPSRELGIVQSIAHAFSSYWLTGASVQFIIS